MSPIEIILIAGAATIFLIVGVGILVSSWPQPDTRPRHRVPPIKSWGEMSEEDRRYWGIQPQHNPSVTDLAWPEGPMRDEGDVICSDNVVSLRGCEFDSTHQGTSLDGESVGRIYGGNARYDRILDEDAAEREKRDRGETPWPI